LSSVQPSEITANVQASTPLATGILASVVVVAYNNRDSLRECLDSLLGTLPPASELLVIDNASTDGSPELVEENYPTFSVIRNRVNLGFAGGSNLAGAEARGEYIVFLNPDTTTAPGWLEKLLAPLEEDFRVGLTTPQILLMRSPGVINACGNDIHLSGLTLCRGAGLKEGTLASRAIISAVSGAAFAIRRELFNQVGGFDERFFMYLEDTDLSWRCRLAGYDCIYVPDSVVYHDYELRFRTNKTLFQERNRYCMLLKNLRWGSLVALLPVLLLAEVVSWGFVLLRQFSQWRQKFQAYAWVVRNWKAIMILRRQTQSLRKRSDRQLLRLHSWRLDFDQTGPGLVARLANGIFGPLFWTLKGLTFLFVWK
jgi:GT2 family glycosyltransferase